MGVGVRVDVITLSSLFLLGRERMANEMYGCSQLEALQPSVYKKMDEYGNRYCAGVSCIHTSGSFDFVLGGGGILPEELAIMICDI